MKKHLFIGMFCLLNVIAVQSQAIEVLTKINRNGLSLNMKQDNYFSSTEFDTTYLGYEGLELQVDSIEFLHDVYLDIEELGGYTEFYVSNVEYRDSIVIWTGRSYNSYKNGFLVLIQKGEYIGGFISQDLNLWELFPNGDYKVLALKRSREHDRYIGCALDNNIEPSDEEIPDPCLIKPDDCFATIRAILEISPGADDWLNLMFSTLSGDALETCKRIYYLKLETNVNVAFINSGILHKRFLIGKVKGLDFAFDSTFSWSYGKFIPDIGKDINHLEINGTVSSDAYTNGCDLVILLTNQNYPDYGGIVNAIGPPDCYCSIVEIQYALSKSWVFSHEVGHLFGGRHERDFDNEDICNHAYKIETPTEDVFDYTIIAAGGGVAEDNLLNYSNPFVKVNGQRTGTGLNYNAAAIDNNGCWISEIRDDPFWAISLIGKDTICDTISENLTFLAEVDEPSYSYPGTAPYTYIWQYGYEWNNSNFPNLNWLNESDDGDYLSVPYDPEEENKELFVRLIVVSDDNQVLIQVKHVLLFPFGCDGQTPAPPYPPYEWEPRSIQSGFSKIDLNYCDFDLDYRAELGSIGLLLKNNVNIQDSYDEAIISIYGIDGKLIYRENNEIYSNMYFMLDKSLYLNTGIYFLNVRTGCGNRTIKLWIP